MLKIPVDQRHLRKPSVVQDALAFSVQPACCHGGPSPRCACRLHARRVGLVACTQVSCAFSISSAPCAATLRPCFGQRAYGLCSRTKRCGQHTWLACATENSPSSVAIVFARRSRTRLSKEGSLRRTLRPMHRLSKKLSTEALQCSGHSSKTIREHGFSSSTVAQLIDLSNFAACGNSSNALWGERRGSWRHRETSMRRAGRF